MPSILKAYKFIMMNIMMIVAKILSLTKLQLGFSKQSSH